MLKYIFDSWLNGYKRMFCYAGRERRSAFGWFIVVSFILFIVIINLIPFIMAAEMLGAILLFIYIITTFLAMLAYNVRRFHDANSSGWLCLLYLGFMGLTIIVSIFLMPTIGMNRYGQDPKISDIFEKKQKNLIVN